MMARLQIFKRSLQLEGAVASWINNKSFQAKGPGCWSSYRFIHFTTSVQGRSAIPPLSLGRATESLVTAATSQASSVHVTFKDESGKEYPFCFLRDNCQCPQCYDRDSFTRRLLVEDWNMDDVPEVKVEEGQLQLVWSDGHVSTFEGSWLNKRAFTSDPRKVKRAKLKLIKDLWDKHSQIDRFDFEAVMTDDSTLLQWLVTQEKKGICILLNSPREPCAAMELIKRVGFVKPTHYGMHYPIRSKADANSLAYTDSKLGMHNDLPYYEHVPGIIFLHCITQHFGEGGENDLIDGFRLAEYIKAHHPEDFRILTQTGVYFWNKGIARVEQETKEFYKLLKIPLIVLNQDGEVIRVNNSQLRDSYLDLPVEQVKPWYSALRLYDRLMQEQAMRLKLNDGEMLVMDNTRLLHGRTAYNGATGERYMDQTYLDWDEALSKRRVLQERLGVHLE
ncbi:gamma-butyrobetaine dioxygenase-like [Oratosquilla oratoria]|uniref:gamma-butyrobetaine dioxygenase-like n=1 Tax=Oratosquilla oratoria TaxID=337810 RepID=UPI003F769541